MLQYLIYTIFSILIYSLFSILFNLYKKNEDCKEMQDETSNHFKKLIQSLIIRNNEKTKRINDLEDILYETEEKIDRHYKENMKILSNFFKIINKNNNQIITNSDSKKINENTIWH